MLDFGDFEPDDAFTVGDEDIDWSEVERVVGQIESIEGIENDEERLEAAKEWASNLAGDF